MAIAALVLLIRPAQAGDDDKVRARAEEARREYEKVHATFLAACLDVANRSVEGDPGLARRAVEAALAVDPNHAEAGTLLKTLGASPASLHRRSGPHVPSWAGRWQDLLGEGFFGPIAAGDRRLPLAASDGEFSRPMRRVSTGGTYVIEAGFRILETHAKDWMLGIAFGGSGGGGHSAFVSGALLVLDEDRGDVVRPIAQGKLAAAPGSSWHRMAIVVEAGRIDVWLDDQRVIAGISPTDAQLDGDVAIIKRGCAAEVRELWVGRER